MLISSYLSQYKEAMLALPQDRPLLKEDLLVSDFLLASSGDLKMYYAPHNEAVNPAARVMIVGLTPGWTQMRAAYEAAVQALRENLPETEVCLRAKAAASFAGTMRTNLTQMLDGLGLPELLGIGSASGLFRERSLLHTTSLLRFPVFAAGRNYSGSHPRLLASDFLRETALASVASELTAVGNALIIPLGAAVEEVFGRLVRDGILDEARCLWGFPHPSGANGHRHKQFQDRKEQMKQRLERFLRIKLQSDQRRRRIADQ
ncbi:uracil-DNA glycosylase family protein [Paenibacillus tepidiphilus]|uniref:uracil-DNA glycosylase family protein n=1 Tax=Paenibacillus tepidiphilus TaxID=2608683 RepID=UPI001EF081EE|nr:uracil-DNA glycosylase family protein [Paenibacillus tepidiphilus]